MEARNVLDHPPSACQPMADALQVPVSLIAASPLNPRKRWDPAKVAAMAEDLKAHGQIQPIRLRPNPQATAANGRPPYEIVVGETRWRAACTIGDQTLLDAVVRDCTDQELIQLALAENTKRQDLHPLEEADGGAGPADATAPAATPQRWAIVELMGHQRIAGAVTEQLYGGAALVRVDVPRVVVTERAWRPGSAGAEVQRTIAPHTRSLGPAAIYSINWCSELVATVAAHKIKHEIGNRDELLKTIDSLPEEAQAALWVLGTTGAADMPAISA